jgi:uncharacterized protein (DUF2141 family)
MILLTLNMLSTQENTFMDKKLTISIEGVRNDKGYILVSLFSRSDGFPDNKDKADKILRLKAKKGNMEIHFDGLQKTKYAFAIIHDENDNQKLDTGVFGIPKEGFCFSRNVMGTFGPPDFTEASFTINQESSNEQVKIKYW